jgi:hypothetical protein
MFVETRTTVAEVLADVFAEVNALANVVINTAINRSAHPTFSSKTLMRQELNKLAGMYQLALKVAGYENVPAELELKVHKAFRDMQAVGITAT